MIAKVPELLQCQMAHNLTINYREEKSGDFFFFTHMKVNLNSSQYVW